MGFTEIWLLLITTLTLVKASTNSANTNQNFTLPSNCRNQTCGDIKIEYPFGIGNGCFYNAAGFNLTCSYDSKPPKLFLRDGTIQVVGFHNEMGLIRIESPYVILDADTESINRTTLIDLKNSPFTISSQRYVRDSFIGETTSNSLFVFGCNGTASIVDPITNSIVAACSSICSSNSTSTIDYGFTYSGNGYCRIYLNNLKFSKTSLSIQLSRPNENENNHMINSDRSNIIAFICDDGFNCREDQDVQSFIKNENKTGTNLNTSLFWHIKDHSSCKEARNDLATYACRSLNSDCYDIIDKAYNVDLNDSVGYICQCSFGHHGNPYLPYGCQSDTEINLTPATHCRTKCGNMTIPFPFGLKKKCYRSQEFALSCNKSSRSLYQDHLKVNSISLEDGQLELLPNDGQSSESELDNNKYLTVQKEKSIIYNWIVGYETCEDAMKNKSTFACLAQYSSCLDASAARNHSGSAYRCKCMKGYEGNPYIRDGCQGTENIDLHLFHI